MIITGSLQLFVAVAILLLVLAPTTTQGTEVTMTCYREAYTLEHCEQQAHEGTLKTADTLMLETFATCAGVATDNKFEREFAVLDGDDGSLLPPLEEGSITVFKNPDDASIISSQEGEGGQTRNLRSEQRHLGVCDGACISCRSICCLLGYCAGTCGCLCNCDRRRLKGADSGAAGSHAEFIELMEGVSVATALVEASIATVCTSSVKSVAKQMHDYGNKCMGDYHKIQCFATAFV
jgi:hypothetical protein